MTYHDDIKPWLAAELAAKKAAAAPDAEKLRAFAYELISTDILAKLGTASTEDGKVAFAAACKLVADTVTKIRELAQSL